MHASLQQNPRDSYISRAFHPVWPDLDLQLIYRTSPQPVYSKAQASSTCAPPHGSLRFTLLYLVCSSDRLLFELQEGQQCKDMNRKHSIVFQLNVGGRKCITTMMCLYQQGTSCYTVDTSISGHLFSMTATDEPSTPGEQCKSTIMSRTRDFRVAMSCRTWTAEGNMVLIYSTYLPLEGQILGTALSGDKWLLLNGAVPLCCPSLLVSMKPQDFISLNKVLLFTPALSVLKWLLAKINRWYQNTHLQRVCIRKMKALLFLLIADVGSNTNILRRRFKVHWFSAETQRLTRWIQNPSERLLIRIHSCCIQIISVKVCLYDSTPGEP